MTDDDVAGLLAPQASPEKESALVLGLGGHFRMPDTQGMSCGLSIVSYSTVSYNKI
jgi:hypothetical protein